MWEASEDLTFLVNESAALAPVAQRCDCAHVYSRNPACRYCTVDGCTTVGAIIQIPNEESTAACFYFEVEQFPSRLLSVEHVSGKHVFFFFFLTEL